MTKNIITKIAPLLMAPLIIVSSTTLSSASDLSEEQAKIEALSYAPTDSFNDDRFSQFSFESDEYYEHELNDAWLGMPAYSKDGSLIGYIEDAIVDSDGFITEILLGINSSEISIEIDGNYAELTSENVKLELSEKQIAQLVSEEQLASLQ